MKCFVILVWLFLLCHFMCLLSCSSLRLHFVMSCWLTLSFFVVARLLMTREMCLRRNICMTRNINLAPRVILILSKIKLKSHQHQRPMVFCQCYNIITHNDTFSYLCLRAKTKKDFAKYFQSRMNCKTSIKLIYIA
jgi:hypothetical protein